MAASERAGSEQLHRAVLYGVAQCKAAVDRERGGWLPLLRELHPPRGVVIISPSAACRESAEMILGKYQPNGDHFQ